MSDAQRLTLALGGKWSAGRGIACCPAHEDKNPSLSLTDGSDGRLLLHCHAGCDFGAVRDALRAQGLLTGRGGPDSAAPNGQAKRRAAERAHNVKRCNQALDLWRRAGPVNGSLAERYLKRRGITCPLPVTLRYVADCWHPGAKRFPALLGNIEGSNGFAVHRTYLAPDGAGKADISPSKTMLGPTMGGAVRLSSGSGRLVIGEGIETALSLLSGLLDGSMSVWAALSAGGMRGLRLPDRPGQLTIAADGDKVGQQAAQVLAERACALGWQVSLLPAPQGCDWNDVLTGKAAA